MTMEIFALAAIVQQVVGRGKKSFNFQFIGHGASLPSVNNLDSAINKND